jgi:hypothetical protein
MNIFTPDNRPPLLSNRVCTIITICTWLAFIALAVALR